ncbi:MAG: hypothetical protein JW719_07010 [Pirellulales bacterium]|nr:hypothetical protein [Pirellulales bacterium]
MNMISSRRWFSVILICAMAVCGCGPDLPYDIGTVKGTVTYRGKPLNRGTVVFVPMEGTSGPQAVGPIESDGSFEVRSGSAPGVAVGRYKVTVHCRAPLTPEQSRALVVPASLIPLKYGNAETTPYTYEVKKGEDHEFPIELAD